MIIHFKSENNSKTYLKRLPLKGSNASFGPTTLLPVPNLHTK